MSLSKGAYPNAFTPRHDQISTPNQLPPPMALPFSRIFCRCLFANDALPWTFLAGLILSRVLILFRGYLDRYVVEKASSLAKREGESHDRPSTLR